jgi:hypothetical protein
LNPRITIGLLIVLAALGGVLLYTDRQDQSTPGKEADQPAEVFTFNYSDVGQLELRREGTARVFRKDENGQWTLQPGGEAADSRRVEALTARLATLRAARRISATEADVSAYGLANPRIVVRLTLSGGTTHELEFGQQTPVQTGYYAQTAQDTEVYVLPTILVDEIERLIAQPFEPTPTPAPPTPTATLGPTAPPIGAPTLTPVASPTRSP